MNRDAILRAAAPPKWNGIPYRLPPDPRGINSIDCSLFVKMVFEEAGEPFPAGVRTAEQIRQASTPINEEDVLPGDLLFFANTYPTFGASHIGIAVGNDSGLMVDAHERSNDPDAVAQTNIRTPYWQGHWMEARRYERAVAPGPGPAPTPGTVRKRVDADALNVRESPSTAARILGVLQQGSIVRAPETTGWCWVETGVLKGWCWNEYLEDA